jgi:murein DD-endopeptidase MepM/ murein hydrolase activator NlpD
MEETSSRAAGAAQRRLLRGAALALALAGTAAIAAPVMSQGRKASPAVAKAIESAPHVAPAAPERLVWEGADLDGDGAPDFANPTGKGTRQTDAYGCGDFGASRDGGVRRHEGVDFLADVGQRVVAPISGYVSKIGLAYPGDSELKFIEITNPALHYQARVFYIDPTVEPGQAIHVGQPIGTHHSLEQKYPRGITEHVHLEIIDTRGERIDATRVITAHYEPAPGAGRG